MSHDANTEIMERFWEEVEELDPSKIDRKMVDAWVEHYVPLGLTDFGITILRSMALTAPIKRVAEEARAQEARFMEEHDGMSSAEYFWESGYKDAEDEAMREDE